MGVAVEPDGNIEALQNDTKQSKRVRRVLRLGRLDRVAALNRASRALVSATRSRSRSCKKKEAPRARLLAYRGERGGIG